MGDCDCGGMDCGSCDCGSCDCDCGDCDCGDCGCGDGDCGGCDCGNESCCCHCCCGFSDVGNVYWWPICCFDSNTSAPVRNNRQAKETTSADSPVVVSQPTAQAQYVPYTDMSDVAILGLPIQEPLKSDDRGLPPSYEEVIKDSKQ